MKLHTILESIIHEATMNFSKSMSNLNPISKSIPTKNPDNYCTLELINSSDEKNKYLSIIKNYLSKKIVYLKTENDYFKVNKFEFTNPESNSPQNARQSLLDAKLHLVRETIKDESEKKQTIGDNRIASVIEINLTLTLNDFLKRFGSFYILNVVPDEYMKSFTADDRKKADNKVNFDIMDAYQQIVGPLNKLSLKAILTIPEWLQNTADPYLNAIRTSYKKYINTLVKNYITSNTVTQGIKGFKDIERNKKIKDKLDITAKASNISGSTGYNLYDFVIAYWNKNNSLSNKMQAIEPYSTGSYVVPEEVSPKLKMAASIIHAEKIPTDLHSASDELLNTIKDDEIKKYEFRRLATSILNSRKKKQ